MEGRSLYTISEGCRSTGDTRQAVDIDIDLRSISDIEHFDDCWICGHVVIDACFGVDHAVAAQIKAKYDGRDGESGKGGGGVGMEERGRRVMVFDETAGKEVVVDGRWEQGLIRRVFCDGNRVMVHGRMEFDGKFYVEAFRVPGIPELSSEVDDSGTLDPELCSLDSYKSLLKINMDQPYFVILNQPELLKMDYRRLNRLKDFLVPSVNSPFKDLSEVIFKNCITAVVFPKKYSSLLPPQIPSTLNLPAPLRSLLTPPPILPTIISFLDHLSSPSPISRPVVALTRSTLPLTALSPSHSNHRWSECRSSISIAIESFNTIIDIDISTIDVIVRFDNDRRKSMICSMNADCLMIVSVDVDRCYLIRY